MRFDIFRGKIKPTSGWSKKESPKIRTVFMGTPDIAKTILQSLVESEYNIVAVYTQPDRPSGRSQEIAPSPVKSYAVEHKIPVEQPERFDETVLKKFKDLKADLVVVTAYGKILPKEFLEIPGFGCLNVHTSLLPRWRGSSPIQNALMAGDSETGVTIMLMDEGMDTGPIISQKAVPITENHDMKMLLEELSSEGAHLLLETIPLWIRRKIEPKNQNDTQATLCQLIEREDGRIFWNSSAKDIWNQYRGLSPWPGVFTFWKKSDGEFVRLKLSKISYRDEESEGKGRLGEVSRDGDLLSVRCGSGSVLIHEIKASGKDAVSTKDFMNGHQEIIGGVLE